MKRDSSRAYVLPLLVIFLLIIGILLVVALTRSSSVETSRVESLSAADRLPLADAEAHQGFRFQDVPSWLFVHVAVIASLQVLSLIGAQRLTQKRRVTTSQASTVQFLCEVPMYLGLFGTLLGVCMTQFITGSLVAPLAYLTTMSGILLHVFGKLTIWLPLMGASEAEL